MDLHWKKKLEEDYVNARVEGAFDRADRGNVNSKVYVDTRKMNAQKALAATMQKAHKNKLLSARISQMRDYLHDQYGTVYAVGDEDLQATLKAFGKKSDDHRKAEALIHSLLVSNAPRSDHWAGQAVAGKFGPGEQIGMALAELNTDEKTVSLASEFLGLEDWALEAEAGQGAGRIPNRERKADRLVRPEAGRDEGKHPSEGQGDHTTPAFPAAKPKSGGRASNAGRSTGPARNPFDLESPDLPRQVELLSRNPARARTLILQTGRDPSHFGLPRVR